MIEGNIYINRQAVSESAWYSFGNPSVAFVMQHLIYRAAYRESTWHGIKLKRGDVLTSIGGFGKPGNLSDELHLSVAVVRNSLKRLEDMGEIKTESKRGYLGYTMITVVNYDKYTATKDKPKGEKQKEDDGAIDWDSIPDP